MQENLISDLILCSFGSLYKESKRAEGKLRTISHKKRN